MPGKAHAMRFRFESHMFRVCRNNREELKKRGSSLFLKRHTHSACVSRPIGKGRKGKRPLRAGRGTLRRRRAPAENLLSLTEVIPPRARASLTGPEKRLLPGNPPQSLPLKRTSKIAFQIAFQIAPRIAPRIAPPNRPQKRSQNHTSLRAGAPAGEKGLYKRGHLLYDKEEIY